MKTVLHISSATTWRGAEQQIDYMINQQNNVYNQLLFCPENSALAKQNAIKLITYKKRFGVDILAAIKLKSTCKQRHIDIIHLHDSHAINTYILATYFGLNIPAIIHRHVNFQVNNKWKYKHKKIEKIICVSEQVKQTMSFIDAEKLVVVNPGIDINRFKIQESRIKTETLKKDFTIGTVTSLEPEKNIEEFIEIANQLSSKRNDIKFVVVGDGSLKSIVNSQQSIVKFLGFRNDIPEVLSTFDVFLFTTKNEGFGQVLLEAMAAKIPIVCSNFPAAKEIIEDGKNGFIYKDVDSAIDKIEILNSTIEKRDSIIENALTFVQNFDLSLMNKKIELVYNSIFLKTTTND